VDSLAIEMSFLERMKTKIFADGADLATIIEMHKRPYIKGFTTNPTLMRKAGVGDYEDFARSILDEIKDLPVSFEVIADDFAEMRRQALKISQWASNVNVKIPITNTTRESSIMLVRDLAENGVKINVTAMTTLKQLHGVTPALKNAPSAIVSLLAGRIADTGIDPVPVMAEAVSFLKNYPNVELLWGSPRELFNILQAEAIGCQIITVNSDLLKKLDLIGKNLEELSLETVKMFFEDAKNAGYRL
jgi:transaldolase